MSTTPSEGLTVLDVRERLVIAMAVETLAEGVAIQLATALAQPSSPVALCSAFKVLAAHESLSPVMQARAIECAEAIANGQFHGLADAAATYAAAARAALAS